MAEAYIRGLERRLEEGKSVDINSVASFFVSRVDTEVDKRLEGAGHDDLLGKAGIANARAAYQRYEEIFLGERFAALRDAGAAVQRPLWASTGVKNPAYRDVMYVEELVGPNTVNTMPMATLLATGDHAEIPRRHRRRGSGRRSSRRWPTPASTWRTSPTSCCARASRSSSSRWRSCSRASAPSAKRSSPSARRRSTPRCRTTTSSRAWPRASSGPRRRTSPGASGARTTRSGAPPASPRWPTASGGWT